MIRCFKVKSSNEIFTSLFSSLNIKANEIVCIGDSQWLINLTRRKAFILLPEEMDNLLKLHLPNEFKVEVVSRHRYEPRKHYTVYSIYKVSPGKKPRRRYFIEVYDGSSTAYTYYFCDSRAKCNSLEKDLEEDNIMLY